MEAGALCLTVRDDGIGILPDLLDQIFDMFSQLDAGSARSDGGLGIGLALVKGLVELHGGTVEAKSAGPGQGSQFMVRLPPAVTTTEEIGSPSEASTASQTGRRVLIADDNKDAADSLATLLQMGGHDVRVVYNGRAALALAQSFRPDVALLDIGMPELSGYEIALQLRGEPWGTAIQLFALTGWGQDGDRQRTKEAGFDLHFTSPLISRRSKPYFWTVRAAPTHVRVESIALCLRRQRENYPDVYSSYASRERNQYGG